MSTRLYWPITSPSVSPTFGLGPSSFGIAWGSTGSAVRCKLTPTKEATVITPSGAISYPGGTNSHMALQAVSEPLAAQTILGTDTCKGQLLFSEANAAHNIDLTWMALYLVSNDGSTYRKTLMSLNAYGSTTEFAVLSTYQNRILSIAGTYSFATYGSEGGDIAVTDGDRLVVEIGASSFTGGTAGSYRMKYGDDATDLPDGDESQTTDGAGWIELTTDLVFQSAYTPLDPMGAMGFFGA